MKKHHRLPNCFFLMIGFIFFFIPVSQTALVWHADFESPGSTNTPDADNTFSSYGTDTALVATNGFDNGMIHGMCGKWTGCKRRSKSAAGVRAV